MGRIARAHGVHGEVRVLIDSDNPERFKVGAVFSCRPEQLGVLTAVRSERTCLTISGLRGESDFPIIKFAEVADRNDAAVLRGYVMEVPGDQLPALEEDEYYPFDLIGLKVLSEKGVARGHVKDVIESPAHGLLLLDLFPQASKASNNDVGNNGIDSDAIWENSETCSNNATRKVLVPFVEEAVPEVRIEDGYLLVLERFLTEYETH